MAETNNSAKFELVKDFYERGLWSAARVANAVGRWITQAEADEITGAGA